MSENAFSNAETEADQVSIQEILLKLHGWWKFLLSKWHIIGVVALICGLLGFSYAYFKKATYTAELTFVLEGAAQTGSLGNYSGLVNQFGLNMGGGQGVFEGENFLALMKSRLMIQKALLTTVEVNNKKITLAEFYIRIKNLREEWTRKNLDLMSVKFLPHSDFMNFSTKQNSLINSFHKSIVAKNLFIDKQDKKSNVIVLRVTSENELFSKYFAEVLAKEVSEFYVETKTKKSVENLKILQHQTDSIRRALNSSMMNAASAVDAVPNLNPAKQVLRVPSQRRQGDIQTNQAILMQLVQNLESAKMALRTETPLIVVIDKPVLPLDKVSPDRFMLAVSGILIGAFLSTFYLVGKKLLIG